jgi:hypothetical protein
MSSGIVDSAILFQRTFEWFYLYKVDSEYAKSIIADMDHTPKNRNVFEE